MTWVDPYEIVWGEQTVVEMDRETLIAFIGQLNWQIARLAADRAHPTPACQRRGGRVMEVFVYFAIAVGCVDAGWSFWRALCWPVALGRLLVAMTPQDREAQG